MLRVDPTTTDGRRHMLSRSTLGRRRSAPDDESMTKLHSTTPSTQPGRIWGWLSGLGLMIAPWLVAGVVSTFTPDPEAVFPWAFLAALVGMLGWIAYGSVRLPGFRKGGIAGSVIALATFGIIFGVARWLQP